MSVVSGVTLQISVSEEYTERDAGPDVYALVVKINDWLKERNFGPLESVEGHYGGSKHPQVAVFGAGYNYFPEDDFAGFVTSLNWNLPECVVLLVNPEEGSTKVVRPPPQ
jgi:hypothetical protein